MERREEGGSVSGGEGMSAVVRRKRGIGRGGGGERKKGFHQCSQRRSFPTERKEREEREKREEGRARGRGGCAEGRLLLRCPLFPALSSAAFVREKPRVFAPFSPLLSLSHTHFLSLSNSLCRAWVRTENERGGSALFAPLAFSPPSLHASSPQ